MRAETKLKKIMQMEDGSAKMCKLFSFACRVPSQYHLWNEAFNEINRLWGIGFRYL